MATPPPTPVIAEGWPEYPPRSPIPRLALDESTILENINAGEIVDDWVLKVGNAIEGKNAMSFESLFVEESWWRDLVALGWDVSSKYGPRAISSYVLESNFGLGQINVIRDPSLQPRVVEFGPATFLQAAFSFTNKFGNGRGMVRLANCGPGEWKAWTVSTELDQLTQPRQENGLRNGLTNGLTNGQENGKVETKADQLQVLVIGGGKMDLLLIITLLVIRFATGANDNGMTLTGQCGLSLAAQLQHMGLQYVLVEKTARIGDSWRNRYSTLKTHTPIVMDSLPFLSYPTNWRRNRTKDQYGDWLECYSKIMQLKIRTSTYIRNIVRDEASHMYSVEMETNGTPFTVAARHIVLATGLHGGQPTQLNVPGQDTFRGELYHSSRHKSASEVSNLANKSITIVGAGTSGHDVAKDFADHGAKSVTMIQRSPSIFVSMESLDSIILGLWMTPHLTTADADLIETSFPNALALTLASGTTPTCAEFDKELIQGMEKAGMAIRKGEDGIGLLDHLILKSGHLYVDQGAAQMIADGRIKIHRSKEGVGAFYDRGIELADGTKVESDVIVLATGWEKTGIVVERLLGKTIADEVNAQEWGKLDEESERKGVSASSLLQLLYCNLYCSPALFLLGKPSHTN